jgi:MFS family permease
MAKQYKVYGYRWVVLAVFMLVNLTMQILWIAYAPITGPAASFYGVSDAQIGLFSMVFMMAFIPLSIPVAWVIDTFGFRLAVSIGCVLMGVFGITRGLAEDNYTLALWSSIGIAVAQPFLLNAWSKVAANWFPIDERATAIGIVTLANLVGTALGMILSPVLSESMSIPRLQLIYGVIAAISAVLFLFLARDKPATPPDPAGQEARALMWDGLKHALTIRSFWLYLVVAFIGLGIFNGLTTWVEAIIRPRGFTPIDAGAMGALMIVGGAIGAVILPALSDKQHKRKLYLYIALLGGMPGMLGMAFATDPLLLFASAFSAGFFMVSALPVGMQYSAEITHPTPEGTSNSLIQLFGQAAVVFVYVMEAMKTPDGSFTPSLLLALALMVVSVILIALMRETPRTQPVEIKAGA